MKNLPTPAYKKPLSPHTLALGIKLALVLAAPVLLATPAYAALSIPPSPLQAGNGVAANLMFILDDSGSMHWEAMPDSLTYSDYLFPPPSHVYGGANYSDGSETIVAFDDTSSTNTKVRSWYNNKVHYNPSITYTPWVKYDGTSYGNASPTRARFNPYTTGGTCNATSDPNNQCIDLTIEQKYTRWTGKGNPHSDNYWPITFYQYKGTGSVSSYKSYIKYQIRGSSGYSKDLNGGSEKSVTTFTWPGGVSRTAAEERQNFANWFTYYRSRILSVRGGAGLAFQGLNAKSFRVGFTTINNGGINYQIPITSSPVDGNFEGTYKQNFYERLYQWPIPQSGTPLRRALNVVGKYYQNTTSGGPWAPDIGGAGLQVSCRQSFAILTTDGYWNGPNQNIGNEDGTDGSTITGLDGASFKYIAENPYRDDRKDTLADAAMKYWKQDLRPESFMKNDVPTSAADPAFWQHMSTFGVSLGANGTLDPATDLPKLISGTKTWPDPFGDYANKIDDLWHATLNGRGAFVAAQDPNEFAEALKSTLGQISDRVASASNISGNSTSLSTDSAVFQAKYTGGKWHGELVATKVTDSGLEASPMWLASSMIPAAASRSIWTWKNPATKGIAFNYANLTSTQQTALGSADVVNYLRGDQSKEMVNGGTFRNRTEVLGDIVHSSPIYLKDNDTVFVGANDGMLHGFSAKTGVERFAYIPGEFLTTGLKKLSETTYTHRYFMDGAIAVSSKTQTNGQNYLTSAMGRGARGLIGLNVTNPSSFSATNVLWEYTPSVNPEPSADPAAEDMGYILGKPIIAKANNDQWVVITGNGYNSDNETAVLYVIDLATGDLLAKIDTGKGSSSNTNGLTTPKGWDADNNGTVDYVYAGDLLGNMWKFDLSSNNTSKWATANKGSPMFIAKDASGKLQPITGGVSIAINPNNSDPNFGKRFVFFGTGRYITLDDSANMDTQTWYGVIDDGKVVSRSELMPRSITTQATSSGKVIRAFSKAGVGDMSKKMGWYVDLLTPGGANGGREGERIITDSMVVGTALLASSIIPGSDDICRPSGRGFVNAIDPFTGSSLTNVFFDFNNNEDQDDGDKMTGADGKLLPIGSIDYNIGMPSEPVIMGDLIIIGGSLATSASMRIFPSYPTGRISWREIIGN
ncbi:MAG: hypothetical protein B7Y40_09195 [Gammaproteobacteria bacterium 28-57-27]|nr:MAG: hypothetical protein B7Y40_09195 [Gammaproteobacteria bacterium 28-57-27]